MGKLRFLKTVDRVSIRRGNVGMNHMKMSLVLYENEKKIGYISLCKDGSGIKSKYIADIHDKMDKASVFRDDYALSRGITISQRCFPGKLIDIEVLE